MKTGVIGFGHELCHQRKRSDAHAHGRESGLRGHVRDRSATRRHARREPNLRGSDRRLHRVIGIDLRRRHAAREQEGLLLQREIH